MKKLLSLTFKVFSCKNLPLLIQWSPHSIVKTYRLKPSQWKDRVSLKGQYILYVPTANSSPVTYCNCLCKSRINLKYAPVRRTWGTAYFGIMSEETRWPSNLLSEPFCHDLTCSLCKRKTWRLFILFNKWELGVPGKTFDFLEVIRVVITWYLVAFTPGVPTHWLVVGRNIIIFAVSLVEQRTLQPCIITLDV